MQVLKFILPPLLYYIVGGQHTFFSGERHLSRQRIQVFDLLYVRKGTLYIAEENNNFRLQAGETLILRPDCHHYGTRGCDEETSYIWLHFYTAGSWSITDTAAAADDLNLKEAPVSGLFDMRTFELRVPQYVKLSQPDKMEEKLVLLHSLAPSAHISTVGLKQQMLFQEVIQQLADLVPMEASSISDACAEQAASFLRSHYKSHITAQTMKEGINFHPVYIARCMKRKYGCSPMEYLLRYRIEQSKLLLMQSNYSISRIAEEVGFNQTPYFSSRFCKLEGISPREFRRRFSQ